VGVMAGSFMFIIHINYTWERGREYYEQDL